MLPLSRPSQLLTRTLICRRDSGNCATSPRNLTAIQAVNQSVLRITADSAPPPLPSLVVFQKPFDFSGVFPPNKVNPSAGGAGLSSEVETWQNEDDRPASEVVKEGEGEAGGERGGVRNDIH